MAGDYLYAKDICQEMCNLIGFCVTVTKTVYVYTNGEEEGFIVGLINYPRFPLDRESLFDRAIMFAEKLRLALDQKSYSIQLPDRTVWNSYRDEYQ